MGTCSRYVFCKIDIILSTFRTALCIFRKARYEVVKPDPEYLLGDYLDQIRNKRLGIPQVCVYNNRYAAQTELMASELKLFISSCW